MKFKNKVVYLIGVCATVHNIPSLPHWKSRLHRKSLTKWGRKPPSRDSLQYSFAQQHLMFKMRLSVLVCPIPTSH